MADPFVGEVRLFAGNVAPRGWANCDGALLSIQQNQALFSLLGTTYGGNGVTNFALPDLRDRLPMHAGNGHVLGERAGEAAHSLTSLEMPQHTHAVNATDDAGTAGSPAGAVWAATTGEHYGAAPQVAMAPTAVTTAGGSQPHENRPPYLVLSFIIALNGIFPSRN